MREYNLHFKGTLYLEPKYKSFYPVRRSVQYDLKLRDFSFSSFLMNCALSVSPLRS